MGDTGGLLLRSDSSSKHAKSLRTFLQRGRAWLFQSVVPTVKTI